MVVVSPFSNARVGVGSLRGVCVAAHMVQRNKGKKEETVEWVHLYGHTSHFVP